MATNQSAFMNINILVVDDDSTSLAIVSAMLKMWKHQVVTSKTPIDALSTLCAQGGIDLVVTDLHMPGMNGFELQEIIQLEFKLPVIIMSSDDQESVILDSMERGAALYLSKPLKPNDLKNVWQYALLAKQFKLPAILGPINGGRSKINQERRGSIIGWNEKLINDEVLKSGSSSLINVEMRGTKKRKSYERRIKEIDLEFDEQNNINIVPKKTKVVWTSSLHTKFLQAMHEIGFQKAVPKKILEVMNVSGLTRENVASHLQVAQLSELHLDNLCLCVIKLKDSNVAALVFKYRLYLKSSRNKLDSSQGITETTFKLNSVVGHDSLLFKTHNRAQYLNPTTNSPSTINFTQLRHPNIRNQNSINESINGRSCSRSNLLTNHQFLFGGSRKSIIRGKMNNSSIYQQTPNHFEKKFSVNAKNGLFFGGIPNGPSSRPIYQQDQTKQQVAGPFGVIGYSSNYDMDETSGGGHIPIVNNKYHTLIISDFTNNSNNYNVGGNMTCKRIDEFHFNNKNGLSYGECGMKNDNYNGNNSNFVPQGGYNMVQEIPSSGICNGNNNNLSDFEITIQQPPQLLGNVSERFGLTYEHPEINNNNMLYDSISQVPNEQEQVINPITSIEQVFVDHKISTLNQRSEIPIPNLVIEKCNLGADGDDDEANIVDSAFEEAFHILDNNYSSYVPIPNYQEQSIIGDIFDAKINNHPPPTNQSAIVHSWTDEDRVAFTFENDMFKEI
ncbi:hypothetical protein ACFE04_010948 [Oxalis oulophora]